MEIRVLHMTLAFSRGGRREAIVRLAEGLRGHGVACDLCSLTPFDAESASARSAFARSDAVVKRGLWDTAALARLRRLCHEWRPDLLHTHDAPSQFLAAAHRVTSAHSPPVVMTFHRSLGLETERLRDRVRNAVSLTRVSAIVTGSAERQAYFRRMNWIPDWKVVRIPFGVDAERFAPDPAGRAARRAELGVGPEVFLCGAVGHFGPEKGLDVVLRGFGEMLRIDAGSPGRLAILGDGPPARRAELEALAAEVAPGRVDFLGFRSDVASWYPAFDVLIHAPRLEAFGLAVAEAMASGLPVIGAAVGGVPDLVRHGVTGMLVPAEHPERIGTALARLARDPILRARLGSTALRVARTQLSGDLYAARHRALYENLLRGHVDRSAPATEPLPSP